MAALVFVVALGIAVTLLVVRYAERTLGSRSAEETVSGVGREILVMRTPGGLLEVALVTATEQFDKKFIYTVVGLEVGETVAHIRVPATYRYHMRSLRHRSSRACPWPLTSRGWKRTWAEPGTSCRSTRSRTWMISSVKSPQCSRKTHRAAPTAGLQREAARKTVTEFVAKWLVTQQEWKDAESPRVEVVFGE